MAWKPSGVASMTMGIVKRLLVPRIVIVPSTLTVPVVPSHDDAV